MIMITNLTHNLNTTNIIFFFLFFFHNQLLNEQQIALSGNNINVGVTFHVANICQIQEDMITFLKKTEYTPRFCKISADPI